MCRLTVGPGDARWHFVHHSGVIRCMEDRKRSDESHELKRPDSPVRASISFPAGVYQTLEEIARRKKVSLAWVVREAAEQYVEGQTPLFGRHR